MASQVPMWVFGSDFHVALKDRKAMRMFADESPYCAISEVENLLPCYGLEGTENFCSKNRVN